MRERGIIFTGESVRAILAGRKTQTRRVARFIGDGGYSLAELADCRHVWECHADDGTPQWQDHDEIIPNRYGVPGDRLWVRETWAWYPDADGPDIVYRADAGPEKPKRWESPLFMARYQSRVTLDVVAVRVERVQEISEIDAKAEGAQPSVSGQDEHGRIRTHRTGFVRGWESINGKRPGCAWSDNPWCWVVEFRKVSP